MDREKLTEEEVQTIFNKSHGHCIWCDRKLVFSWRGKWDKRYEGGWDVDDFDNNAEEGEDDLGNLFASCIPCIAIKGNIE